MGFKGSLQEPTKDELRKLTWKGFVHARLFSWQRCLNFILRYETGFILTIKLLYDLINKKNYVTKNRKMFLVNKK